MEFSITLSTLEFIIATISGPLIASAYFLIKKYLEKAYKWKIKFKNVIIVTKKWNIEDQEFFIVKNVI